MPVTSTLVLASNFTPSSSALRSPEPVMPGVTAVGETLGPHSEHGHTMESQIAGPSLIQSIASPVGLSGELVAGRYESFEGWALAPEPALGLGCAMEALNT
jgi:hypothetical protein